MQKRIQKENGYALLAMLAGLTIALIVLAAAAAKPSVRFESQRENEEEMMYRAVQVANAIYLYAITKTNARFTGMRPGLMENFRRMVNGKNSFYFMNILAGIMAKVWGQAIKLGGRD